MWGVEKGRYENCGIEHKNLIFYFIRDLSMEERENVEVVFLGNITH